MATSPRPAPISISSKDQHLAYILLRLLTGLDFFGHGFARIFTGTHLSGFAQGMVKNMASTPLPPSLTLASGYAIPCTELLIGILLLLGLFTRSALVLALLLMCMLMFGITLKQDWATAGTQLGYGFVLAALLFARPRYDLSWPALFSTLVQR
ncbi:DoxX family membrane protein [Granulicella sp. 5B5]|uniref:DoxX family membrane protein n=1 Tax=Granulicella sp. 5B5 TaxID=1617967 RepID=UPI0015F743C5|nr:DoxX family membrane protein [Granulicella sp. 5B5]